MKIVVTHLTRMECGFICTAGVDPDTGRHVRPVLQWARLPVSLLAENGGPFRIGALVDLGQTWECGEPPAVEDWAFVPADARSIGEVNGPELWEMLRQGCKPHLKWIFGPELRREGRTCVVDLHQGQASLGCLAPASPPVLAINEMGRLRLQFWDGELSCSASVSDVRFYEPDHATIRNGVVKQVAAQIADGVPVILGVGLTRPYLKPGDSVSRHWLQVNNIHLEANPLWAAGDVGTPLTANEPASAGREGPRFSTPAPAPDRVQPATTAESLAGADPRHSAAAGRTSEIFSERVRIGGRTYYLDVKQSGNGGRYLSIRETGAGASRPDQRIIIPEEGIVELLATLQKVCRFLRAVPGPMECANTKAE